MSEGLRRPEGLAPTRRDGSRWPRAPGKGPHPLLSAFAELGWRPTNDVVRWLNTLPRETTVEQAIRALALRSWIDTLRTLGASLRALRPPRYDLLALLPPWAAHGTDPQPARHPAEAWRSR